MSQTFGDWDGTASNNTTVGTGAIDIDEGCLPGNVNDALREIMAAGWRSWGGSHSGTARPAGLPANRFWLDTTTATAPILKWYDGTDDIIFLTFNHTANTVSVGSSGSVTIDINGLTADASPDGGADYVMTYDASAAGNKKVLLNNLPGSLDINGLTAETAPATGDALPFYDASAAANRKITFANLFKLIDSLTAETAPATGDKLALYDASGLATDSITLADLFKVIDGLTAETAPAIGDELALYDASALATDKITLENLFKVINGLTEDTTPDTAADFVVAYDASAAAAKKVKLSNLGTAGGWEFIASQDASASATLDFTGFDAAKYDSYMFALSAVTASVTSVLWLRTSTDGGVNYDSAASDYAWSVTGGTMDSVPVAVLAGANSDTRIALMDGQSGPHQLTGEIFIHGPHLARRRGITGNLTAITTTGGLLRGLAVKGFRLAEAPVNAVRFMFSTGNIASGTITMYGLRNA